MHTFSEFKILDCWAADINELSIMYVPTFRLEAAGCTSMLTFIEGRTAIAFATLPPHAPMAKSMFGTPPKGTSPSMSSPTATRSKSSVVIGKRKIRASSLLLGAARQTAFIAALLME
jgi:hypothetical protein